MSILQGVKAVNLKSQKTRFVIKPKLTAKQNRQQVGPDCLNVTDNDVHLFIQYLINKSNRLKQLLDKKNVFNQQEFYQKHLYNSTCLKTILKQILDKMMSDRRLGKNLKGMNKSNLTQIENGIWTVVERQMNLYQNQLEYTRQKQQLKADLRQRKQTLLQQITKLTVKDGKEGKSEKEGDETVSEGSIQNEEDLN